MDMDGPGEETVLTASCLPLTRHRVPGYASQIQGGKALSERSAGRRATARGKKDPKIKEQVDGCFYGNRGKAKLQEVFV
jgi:hypothetical protein